MKHDSKINKKNDSSKINFFQHNNCFLLFMNAVIQPQGGKGREGVLWEATLNQGDSPSFPDTCHV